MKTVGPLLVIVPIQNSPDIHLNLSTDLNIRLIVLKFVLTMFLRYISVLPKYGPDRPIFRSSLAKMMSITAKFVLCLLLLDPIEYRVEIH